MSSFSFSRSILLSKIVSLIAVRQSSLSSLAVRRLFDTSDGNSVRDVLREIRRIICIRLGTGAARPRGTAAVGSAVVGALLAEVGGGGGRGAGIETGTSWGANNGCTVVGIVVAATAEVLPFSFGVGDRRVGV